MFAGSAATGSVVQGTALGSWLCDRTGEFGGRDGGRVRRGLVDDQVADHARLGVDDVAAASACSVVGPGRCRAGEVGRDCGSASRNDGSVSRGNSWSDAAKVAVLAALRLLQEPSTVRRPYDVR